MNDTLTWKCACKVHMQRTYIIEEHNDLIPDFPPAVSSPARLGVRYLSFVNSLHPVITIIPTSARACGMRANMSQGAERTSLVVDA